MLGGGVPVPAGHAAAQEVTVGDCCGEGVGVEDLLGVSLFIMKCPERVSAVSRGVVFRRVPPNGAVVRWRAVVCL